MHHIVYSHRVFPENTLRREMAANARIVADLAEMGAWNRAMPFLVAYSICKDEADRRRYERYGEDYGQWISRYIRGESK